MRRARATTSSTTAAQLGSNFRKAVASASWLLAVPLHGSPRGCAGSFTISSGDLQMPEREGFHRCQW